MQQHDAQIIIVALYMRTYERTSNQLELSYGG